MFGFRQLAPYQVSREEQLDSQYQLFLNIHFGFIRCQLDKAVPGSGGLIGRGAVGYLDRDRG